MIKLMQRIHELTTKPLDSLYFIAHPDEKRDKSGTPGRLIRRTYSYDYYRDLKLMRYRLMFMEAMGAGTAMVISLFAFLSVSFLSLKAGMDLFENSGGNKVFLAPNNAFQIAHTVLTLLMFVFLFHGFNNKVNHQGIASQKKVKRFRFWLYAILCLLSGITIYAYEYKTMLGGFPQISFVLVILIGLVSLGVIYYISKKELFKFVCSAIMILVVSFFPLILHLYKQEPKPSANTMLGMHLQTGFISLLVIWLALVYYLIPLSVCKRRETLKGESGSPRKFLKNILRSLIYWKYFIGATTSQDISSIVGIMGFVAFSLLSFIVLEDVPNNGPFQIWSYSSAFFTAAILAFRPILAALRDLKKLFIKTYNDKTEVILSKLHRHLVVVGMDNLGRSAIRFTFQLVHGGRQYFFESQPRGFCLYIDSELEINIVSERVIAIDMDANRFIITDNTMNDYSLGLFRPFSEDAKVYIIGICGKTDHPSVIQAAKVSEADLLVSTISNYHENMFLARLDNPRKKILSYADAPSFNAILSQGFGNPVFAFNANLIEGVSISQKIIQYMMKQMFANRARGYHRFTYEDLRKIPPVLLVGEYRLIHQILHAMVLACESQLLNEEDTKNLLTEKIMVFMKDKQVSNEIEDNTPSNDIQGFKDWTFFPVRRENQSTRDAQYRIKIFNFEPNNYELFNKAYTALWGGTHWPGLIVFLKDNEHDSVEMIDRGINALIPIIGSNAQDAPQILASCSHPDRSLVSNQLQRYRILYQKPEDLIYPSRHPKDALLNRGMVAGNQIGTLIDALFDTHSPQDEAFVNFQYSSGVEYDAVANLSYCLGDNTGSLMRLLAALYNWGIIPEKAWKNERKPSFSFCYTFNDLHVSNQFVFTGTAFLHAETDHSGNNFVHAWSLDCEHPQTESGTVASSEGRGSAAGVRDRIIGLNDFVRPDCLKNHGDVCRRLNADCTISNYCQNKYQYTGMEQDIDYFGYNTRYLNKEGKEDWFDEKVHFKLWAGPSDCPGSLAKAMIDLMLYRIDTESLQNPSRFVPSIEFCTSIPCGAANTALADIYARFIDFSGNPNPHTRQSAAKFSALMDNDEAPINAVKIKLSQQLEDNRHNTCHWLGYAQMLAEFLNGIYDNIGVQYRVLVGNYSIDQEELVLKLYDAGQDFEFPFAAFRITNSHSYNLERNLQLLNVDDVSETWDRKYSEIFVVNETFMGVSRTNRWLKLVSL